jgi:hypothetical protein
MTNLTNVTFNVVSPSHVEAALRCIASAKLAPYPPPNAATVLRDIREAIDTKDHLWRGELWTFAQQEFARLNCWKVGGTSFAPDKIGKRPREIYYYRDNVFDHNLYFREDGKAIAIVAQPYKHVCENQAYQAARYYRLDLIFPRKNGQG